MKLVKCGRVYDLDYSKYEVLTNIPSRWERNSAGNLCEVRRELRRDIASGEFYILTTDGGYGRENYSIDPITKEDAMMIAESYLDYDRYIKFFGDPEGTNAGIVRERDKAVEDKKQAESSKDYWYEEYSKANAKVAELEKRIAELEAK